MARSAASPSAAKMLTVPSSSTSILHAGLLDDAADHLAARSDDLADLVGRNGHGVDARRVRRQLGARLGDHGVHLVEDEQPRLARLLQRFRHDGGGDVRHLDVHLQGGDAVRVPATLKSMSP